LSGKVNPSGRLPITYPRYDDSGGIPYFRAVSDQCTSGSGTLPHYESVPCEVEWPFGHGLSYTMYEYSDLVVTGGRGKDLIVSVKVQNTGAFAGSETVMFFTFDLYRSTTPEYKRLRAFEKIHLEVGQEETVTKIVPADDLKFIGPHDDKHYISDPQLSFLVGVGASTDCRPYLNTTKAKRIILGSTAGSTHLTRSINSPKASQSPLDQTSTAFSKMVLPLTRFSRMRPHTFRKLRP
jgi:beta-glucosidase